MSVAVLGEMGDDGLAGPVAAQNGVFVIKYIAPIAHQVRVRMTYQEMDAVVAGSPQRIELEVARIVVANGVLVQLVQENQQWSGFFGY
jgi:hypothetical protein